MVMTVSYTHLNREHVDKEKIFGHNKYYQRQKNIFYDTDYIEEEQLEKVRFCAHCPGYLLIESKATRNYGNPLHLFAVSIPFTACSRCQVEAYDAYEWGKLNRARFDYVYLQDKSIDTCLAYESAKNQEWVSEGPKPGV